MEIKGNDCANIAILKILRTVDGRMEVLVKLIVTCVIISYVLAKHKHHHNQHSSTEKAHNLTEKVDRTANIRKHLVDCTEETKINPDIILNLRSGKWRQALKKEPPILKKWSLCLLVKSEMMSPDGVLRQDVVLGTIPLKDRARVEKIIDQCLFKKHHSPTEIAWNYIKCFHSKSPKYSII